MEYSICHPLKGVCISLNLVGAHLERRDWISPTLTEDLLPPTSSIVYTDAVGASSREDSRAVVTYNTGTFILAPGQTISRPLGGNMFTLQGSLVFTVSTTNKALTRELLFEIGALFAAQRAGLINHSFSVGNITIPPIQYDAQNYYTGTVEVSASLGYPIWKTTQDSGILREIGIWADTK